MKSPSLGDSSRWPAPKLSAGSARNSRAWSATGRPSVLYLILLRFRAVFEPVNRKVIGLHRLVETCSGLHTLGTRYRRFERHRACSDLHRTIGADRQPETRLLGGAACKEHQQEIPPLPLPPALAEAAP